MGRGKGVGGVRWIEKEVGRIARKLGERNNCRAIIIAKF